MNRRGLNTQPCGEPVLRVTREDMAMWIVMVRGLFLTKSRTQFLGVGLAPRDKRFCRIVILKEEEKSKNAVIF